VAYQDTGINEAGAVASGGTKSDRGNGDMLATMRTRLTMAISAYSDSREDELDDLRFRAASPDNQWQWPADVLATRGSVQGQTINARPCLTINKLPQHVLQVTNDQRQNRPSGKVIPADDKADVEVAEIFNGLVRHIEYISDADVAYDTACDNQVTFGEGYFRILTEYCDDNSFEQDLRIGRIRDSFSVYMDPTIQDPCGSDAEWCFINQELTTEEYEREFPDASPLSSLEYGVGDGQLNAWINQDTVRIAEYFYIKHEAKKLNQYHGGITAMAGSPEAKQAEMMGLQAIKTREVDVRTVKWCKTNGFEVLEERDWAGKYIPVIRVIGNEFEIDGRMYVSGLVRNAKDAQRMYNYWVSQEAEMLALAPKAPFIGYGGQFEGYEAQWKTANINNWPYLEVNPDVTDGQGGPLPLPARSQPPMASSGLLQAKAGAADDIKSSTGQYDSSLGATSNERSGRAILAREKQSDTGTYHYVDNLRPCDPVRHAATGRSDPEDLRHAAHCPHHWHRRRDRTSHDRPDAADAGQEDPKRSWHRHQENLQPQRRQVRCCGHDRPKLHDQAAGVAGRDEPTAARQPATVGGGWRPVHQAHGLAGRAGDGRTVCQDDRSQAAVQRGRPGTASG
jgi:hypothetical protein